MIDLKLEMVRTAKSYLDINTDVKNWLVDYYNENVYPHIPDSRKYKMKYTDKWCAMFISVVAHKVGFVNFPYEVSVHQMTLKAVQLGTYKRDMNTANVGDLVIYNWDRNAIPDHVGIIKSIKGYTLEVIEGNYQNGVGVRTIELHSDFIEGYIKL